jgi:imidazolonepropionase-like amidohydrolase
MLAAGDDVQEAPGVFHLTGVCGLGHRKGRITPGFDADILPVARDPVGDPDALHCIRVVCACGTAVPGAGT